MKGKNRGCLCTLLIILSIYLALRFWPQEKYNVAVHESYRGTVLSYEKSEQGTIVVLDVTEFEKYSGSGAWENVNYIRRFLINEGTNFFPSEAKKHIDNQTIGLNVFIFSEYMSLDMPDKENGLYPVYILEIYEEMTKE